MPYSHSLIRGNMETPAIANSEPEFVMAINTIQHFINARMNENDPELSLKISSVVSQLNMMVNYCFERQQSNVHTIVFNKKRIALLLCKINFGYLRLDKATLSK